MPLWLLAVIKISAWVGFGVTLLSMVGGLIYNKIKENKDKDK